MLLLMEVTMAFDTDRTNTWLIYGKKLSEIPEGPSRFAEILAAYFPDVAATIDETESGNLRHEVDTLKLATRKAILEHDWITARAHFALVDHILESAGIDIHEAIGVSYLVNLFYGETTPEFAKARMLMPKRLASALELMERHFEEL